MCNLMYVVKSLSLEDSRMECRLSNESDYGGSLCRSQFLCLSLCHCFCPSVSVFLSVSLSLMHTHRLWLFS